MADVGPPVVQSVLTYQFDNTPEYSSLLRANTPVSRMMTTYTRRGPGQSYLKEVLAQRINSLIELKDLDLEINPLKVYERMIGKIEEEKGSLPPELPRGVTAEEAAENEQVQRIIEPRLTRLMEIADSFLTTIINGLEETPYGIRWICKQIRSLSKVGSSRILHAITSVRGWAGLEITSRAEKISGRPGSGHLHPHRRILLPAIHQPRHCDPAFLHAD